MNILYGFGSEWSKNDKRGWKECEMGRKKTDLVPVELLSVLFKIIFIAKKGDDKNVVKKRREIVWYKKRRNRYGNDVIMIPR